jgi:hypothetical protein
VWLFIINSTVMAGVLPRACYISYWLYYEGRSESNLRSVTVRVVGGVATPSLHSRTRQVSRHQAVVE